jgi:hypothetical protein
MVPEREIHRSLRKPLEKLVHYGFVALRDVLLRSLPHPVVHNVPSEVYIVGIRVLLLDVVEHVTNRLQRRIAVAIVTPVPGRLVIVACNTLRFPTARGHSTIGGRAHRIVRVVVNVGEVDDFQRSLKASRSRSFGSSDGFGVALVNFDGEFKVVALGRTLVVLEQEGAKSLGRKVWSMVVDEHQDWLKVGGFFEKFSRVFSKAYQIEIDHSLANCRRLDLKQDTLVESKLSNFRLSPAVATRIDYPINQDLATGACKGLEVNSMIRCK